MVRKLPQLREAAADAITFHPGNRTGTPEQRHPVSLMLADAVLRVVRPCTCDGDPIECSHEAARGQAEAELAEARQTIQRVRDHHQPETPPEGHQWVSGGRAPHCTGCATGDPYLDPEWPCDTIRTLDGEDLAAEAEPESAEVTVIVGAVIPTSNLRELTFP